MESTYGLMPSDIPHADTQHRQIKLVYNMDILTAFADDGVAYARLLHDIGKGAPCAKIAPFARKAQDGDVLFLFGNGIVKADLLKLTVF